MLQMGASFFTLFFVVVIAFIAFALIQAMQRQQTIDDLRRTGQRIAATVSGVSHERRQTGGGVPDPTTHAVSPPIYRDDWYIDAQWTDPRTGQPHSFRSDPLTRNDAERYPTGSPITILIDPTDPTRYYVEIAR